MLDLAGRATVATHEDVFLARYRALVQVALRVTDGDRAEAEDLVHEAFIRFTLVQPPLDEVQHLDAYLSRMLRNMYTSRIRRRQRAAETSLSILDYDSLDIGFYAMDASGQLEVREMLRAACEYGCVRKRSSKSGSVFLLRFFHGYLPSEIASLARLSSGIVDALVFRARREVKTYVEHPDQLAFIDGPRHRGANAAPDRRPALDVSSIDKQTVNPAATAVGHAERVFMDELRARIFNDTHDRCWSKKTLHEMYGNRSAEALSRDHLADLVGCPACLDAASALLGLPRLADRWPVDTLGPGSRGGPSGGATTGTIASGRRRSRAVFEHRPRQLRVSVNGFVLGSHTIGADANEMTLSVNLNEPIASIELLSEQDLCLAFLDTSPPPDGNPRQRRCVDLSDGRHAEIEVTFASPWPTVRASYSDPRPRFSAHTEDELAGEYRDTTQIQLVLETPRSRRWFGSRPAWATAVLVIAAWLLFWTPGTNVSAAERIADAIRWLVSAVFASDPPGATNEATPPAPTARDISLPVISTSPVKPAGMDGTRRTYLELKALSELQRVNAYLGQELSFAPRDGSTVRLRGLVETNARKSALLDALGPLLGDSGLLARITNVSQTATRPRQPARTESEAQTFAFTREHFPMFAAVKRYVVSEQHRPGEMSGTAGSLTVDDADIDARTHRLALQLLDRSRRAAQHAWALKHLSERFSAEVISAASPDTRALWQAVVGEHARAYGQELALLRRDLEPVVRMLNGEVQEHEAVGDGMSVDTASDTWTRIARLHEAHRRQDQAIQDAFAVQSGTSDDVDGVRTAAFWRLIDIGEALAASLYSSNR